jgi:hypothetical protein
MWYAERMGAAAMAWSVAAVAAEAVGRVVASTEERSRTGSSAPEFAAALSPVFVRAVFALAAFVAAEDWRVFEAAAAADPEVAAERPEVTRSKLR